MFRASSAHPQEVNDVNYTCMQPLVFSFSAGGRLVHLLRGELCIKLELIKELYYDARPNRSQKLYFCSHKVRANVELVLSYLMIYNFAASDRLFVRPFTEAVITHTFRASDRP